MCAHGAVNVLPVFVSYAGRGEDDITLVPQPKFQVAIFYIHFLLFRGGYATVYRNDILYAVYKGKANRITAYKNILIFVMYNRTKLCLRSTLLLFFLCIPRYILY